MIGLQWGKFHFNFYLVFVLKHLVKYWETENFGFYSHSVHQKPILQQEMFIRSRCINAFGRRDQIKPTNTTTGLGRSGGVFIYCKYLPSIFHHQSNNDSLKFQQTHCKRKIINYSSIKSIIESKEQLIIFANWLVNFTARTRKISSWSKKVMVKHRVPNQIRNHHQNLGHDGIETPFFLFNSCYPIEMSPIQNFLQSSFRQIKFKQKTTFYHQSNNCNFHHPCNPANKIIIKCKPAFHHFC